MAQLVGQTLDLVWRGSNGIIQDSKPCGGRHALFSSNRDQVELVDILVSDDRVNNGSGHGVLEASRITIEDSGVHSFARVDVHQLGRVLAAKMSDRSFDLLNLGNTDALDLTLTDTVTVEDQSSWVGTIMLLEAFESVDHSILQSSRAFLANLVLDYTRGPVSGGRLIHRGSKRKDGLLAQSSTVEDVHTTNHCRFRHEGETIDSPWDTTHLGVHLDEDLGDDRPQVLTLGDSTNEHNL